MISRASAAACAAAALAMVAAPVQSSARGGAVAMGHVGGFHPPATSFNHGRPPSVHPPVAHPPLARAHRAPLVRHDFGRRAGFGAAARRQGTTVGYADFGGYWGQFTSSDDGAFYGSYYDPSDFYGSYYDPSYFARAIDPPSPKVRPAAVVPVAGREPQVADRGGCRSETVVAPSPGFAEGSVTITRC